ncbi:possible sensor protein [Kordia algicida OT-1]|uniref:Possible sensor protein n=1 Tax=Kordia algicida OT-1 TaxID=391587 RepID=A9EDR5_9FLAO|nr:histidine kinase [Kordia algicida]EDP94213.1 possible sensor protein [Kordia algicida OT-1]
MRQVLFSIFFFLLSLVIWAQEPVSIHLTEANGLPDIEFYDSIEDTEGYIWLAGNKGLFRYDGKEFKVYSHSEKRGRSFFNLKLDEKGRLWFTNIAGQYFYIENDNVILFKDLQEILNGKLSDYLITENYLLIYSLRSTLWIDRKTKKIVHETENLGGTSIGFVQNNHYYFLNFKKELLSQDIETKEIEPAVKQQYPDRESLPGFTRFHKTSKGYVVLFQDKTGEKNSLFLYKNKQLIAIKLPEALLNNTIFTIQEYDDKLYFSTKKGVVVTQHIKNKIRVISSYLKNYFTTEVIKDFQQNLWITTLNNGIFIIPNESLQLINTDKKTNVIEKYTDSTFFTGNKNGTLSILSLDGDVKETFNFTDVSEIQTLNYNPNTDILYYNSDEKNIRYHVGQKKIISFDNFNAAKSISHIKNDFYLKSFAHGTFYGNGKEAIKISDKRSYESIYSKKYKKAYVATTNGLLLYDSIFNFEKSISFNNKPIYTFDIEEASNGSIWVATYDNGVLNIKDDKVVEVLSLKNGLASKAINKIKTDGEHLWIVTDNGFQHYNTTTKTFKTINKRDGLLSYNINSIETFGNDVLFSSNIGLFRFDKRTVFKDWETPEVYITATILEEKEVPLKSTYTLKQQESEIEIRFNSKGFQSDTFVAYEYQLKGFNDSWNSVDKGQQHVKFNTLPAGKFTFNLRARNLRDQNYSAVKSLQLNVTLPFYKQAWFLICIMLAILAIVILYFRRKIRIREKQKNKELQQLEIDKQLVNLRLENLRSQMNPHFIFNALNSIQEYIVLNQQNLASTYLVKFSRLIRTYLEQSQEKEITLDQELKALHLYLELEKVRFEEELTYEILVDKNLALETIKIPSLFIQPYIENAIKHGLHHKISNRKLEVSFQKQNEQLICNITDNGIGREAAQKLKNSQINYYKSFATRANTERVELINKDRLQKIEVIISDLTDEKQQPTGTCVSIRIPLKK